MKTAIRIDFGSAPSSCITELLVAIDALYRSYGGKLIIFKYFGNGYFVLNLGNNRKACLLFTKSLKKILKNHVQSHMIACLEEPKATNGYLEAALHFDQLHDTRSALACVYRNVRYRLRDNQLTELDNDLKRFDVSTVGINIMLAVLTSTAPIKSKLTNRRRLFREFKAYLKKSGQLEKGLLDDLK